MLQQEDKLECSESVHRCGRHCWRQVRNRPTAFLCFVGTVMFAGCGVSLSGLVGGQAVSLMNKKEQT